MKLRDSPNSAVTPAAALYDCGGREFPVARLMFLPFSFFYFLKTADAFIKQGFHFQDVLFVGH